MRGAGLILGQAVWLMAACDDHGSGPDRAAGLLSGGYFGGIPWVGPLNAFFVVDRP